MSGRPNPLTVLKGGIDRLRPKGGARADSLYDLVNAQLTEEFQVMPRPGTRRVAEGLEGTIGLVAFEGDFHVFSSSPLLGELWTPAEISTSGWWDASDAETIDIVDGLVQQWDDKSGNDRHWLNSSGDPTTSPSVSAGAVNELDAIDFDGVNDSLSSVGGAQYLFANQSLYFVIKMTLEAARGTVFSQYTAGFPGRVSFISNSNNNGDPTAGWFEWGIGGTTGGGGIGGSMNAMNVGGDAALIESLHGSGAEGWKTYLNGTLGDSATINSALLNVGTRIGVLLGSDTLPYDGLICEIVLVGSIQSDDDRQIMEGYLAWKWGFHTSLPADHPYRHVPPQVG